VDPGLTMRAGPNLATSAAFYPANDDAGVLGSAPPKTWWATLWSAARSVTRGETLPAPAEREQAPGCPPQKEPTGPKIPDEVRTIRS